LTSRFSCGLRRDFLADIRRLRTKPGLGFACAIIYHPTRFYFEAECRTYRRPGWPLISNLLITPRYRGVFELCFSPFVLMKSHRWSERRDGTHSVSSGPSLPAS
jgi:hypothetical protein